MELFAALQDLLSAGDGDPKERLELILVRLDEVRLRLHALFEEPAAGVEKDVLTVTFKTKGGTLKSIKGRNGLEYLWQGDPACWSGQAPILFPICGSLRNDTASIGGNKTTTMPRHGLIRKKEFTAEEKTADLIRFSITSNEEMKAQYPYDYRVSEIFTLSGNEIRVTYRVENTGSETMPFFVGGHPVFCCPLEEGESFSDYHLEFPEKETCAPSKALSNGLQDLNVRTPFLEDTNDLQLSYTYFEYDVLALDTLKSRSVRLLSSHRQRHSAGLPGFSVPHALEQQAGCLPCDGALDRSFHDHR